ncbi:uncharacterized protein LOC112688172 [Sipha flava]|uniref:Uncharacterized protein LOC112688172 n=1 Tax=Sipha flava TaxID=143950 RepID=A0A2S2QY05_9HEMI|nr:uncharacterized protein LOC112688172 [Sipha flava]XP_025417026.1 uncharacterized protein LOC112688172 [Sipha flava]XP_025417027.1 uncharacterized protein LOC112688172 [Sipha flava]
MFCCSVCSVMFNGVYPESVLTTLCGHLFHSECILQCLKKSHKCPFCTLHVEESQLIKLNFQIDTNWKDTAAALKTKANTSVINLDESLNETIKDLTLFGNISLIEIDEDESISGREFFAVNNQIENALQNTKTLLTTSLSSVKLSVTAHDLLLIFNDIIPNSIILKRELISELKIVKTAMDQGFTNLLIINTQSGNPVGLTFFDLLIHRKTFVALSSFECFKYSNTVGKIEVPQLVINYDRNLNESQEFVLTFFSTILPKQCDHKTYDSNTININYCNDCESMKFEFNFIGLKFCMVPQTNFNILR